MAGEVIKELVIRLGYEVDESGAEKFEQGSKEAEKAAEDLGGAVDRTGVKTVALGNILAKGAEALAGMAVEALKTAAAFAVDLVTGFASAGDEVAKTARQTDTNAQSFQRLRFAAERSRVSASSLDRSMRTLLVGLSDVREKGTGPAAEALDLLGLSLDDIPTDDAEGALGIIGDALRDLEDPADRAAAAAKLFGARAGVELKLLLDEGSEGIRDLGDQAERLGGVLDDDALTAAENLTDGFTNLQTALGGAKNQIGAALAPAVLDLTDRLTELLEENEDLIQQDIPRIFESLAEVIPPVVEFSADLLESVSYLIKEYKSFRGESEEASRATSFLGKNIQMLTNPIGVVADLIDKLLKKLDDLADRVDVIGRARDRLRGALGLAPDTETTSTRVSARDIAESVRTGRSQEQIAQERIGAARQAEQIAAQDKDAEARRREEFARQERQQRAEQLRTTASEGPVATATKRTGGGRRRGRRRATAAAAEPAARDPSLLEILGGEDPVASVLGGGASGGATAARAGGGSDPLAGTTINRIDASYNAPVTVTISLNAADLERVAGQGGADGLARVLEDRLSEANRRAFDHYRQAVKP